MPQAYSNQGQPPLPPTSNQMRVAPITPNQFGPPPTMSAPQFQQQPQPPFPNQPPYQQAQYPSGQHPYNAPPSSFPPGSQPPQTASGYPQQTSPPHYPNQPNLSGPQTMPGSQLNGPGAYPGQPPSSGPVQQPYQPQRIDPDMVPNVVRIRCRKLRLSNYRDFFRFKFLNKVKTKIKSHL